MENKIRTFWWKTKTFRIGLGIFIVGAVMVAVFFGDSISQLFDLFGSKAALDQRNITVDDRSGQFPGHGYLNSADADYDPDKIEYIQPEDSENGEGYITLIK